METMIVRPMSQPLYTVNPQQSHPRISLRRVLYVKFLRWVDGASPKALKKAFFRSLAVLTLILLIIAPQFLLGVAFTLLTMKGCGLLKIACVLGSLSYWKQLPKLYRRLSLPRGNQHTYHGLDRKKLIDYLMEQKSFKQDHACRSLGLSVEKHAKIAKELEHYKVLVRGENNSRVLNAITRDELLRQLTEKFPLMWSEERRVWAERGGTFERWAMEKDRREREDQERVERLARKRERLKEQVTSLKEEAKSPFHLALELAA